ncbi:MAG: hypothetical protein LBP42_06485, partial [Treponema sp.]|nr:hypothetical protein [Treponema sp.]
LNTISARTVTFLENKIIAIAGENRGNGAIRLVEIDPKTLEMNKQGEEDMHRDSLIWRNGEDLYGIISQDGNLYLGRFNADLECLARSSVPVPPYGAINFQGDLLTTQRADGSVLILDAGNLTERK